MGCEKLTYKPKLTLHKGGKTRVDTSLNHSRLPQKSRVDTGYYYYGARYYNPKISNWLSVDPIALYDPIQQTEHYIDGEHNGGYYNPKNMSVYGYTYQNPIVWVDPNGKQVFAVHGTWAKSNTFKNQKGIEQVANTAFGNKESNFKFNWSGDNSSSARRQAANELIQHIRDNRSKNKDEPITIVTHSHGGNVAITAINKMMKMKEFKNANINLITINVPVRGDYQLNQDARDRVDHINIFDKYDPVQSSGGHDRDISIPFYRFGELKGTGEIGAAGRTFDDPRVKNISSANPQGVTDDYHNSHNRIGDWSSHIENSEKSK
jgi:RHS repeat-associated protein